MSNEITTPYDRVLIDPNEPLILPDGTAITGRLETFLYALCCLDYDNLPTPLSRIEEFANALITGEIPNIEPQSRSERFFLAILDGNIDNLPEPQSRSEVLLNKLAVGDFDLTNVDPIQSRYELLLAYLIKNGGVGNLDYVLYEFYQATQTLYNTQEKPAKSAILSGNTLVNLTKTIHGNGNINAQYRDVASIKLELLKPSTKYIAYVFNDGEEDVALYWNSTANFQWKEFVCKSKTMTYSIGTSKASFNDNDLVFSVNTSQTLPQSLRCVILEYQEGMENWDIPYFEGMTSCKMPVLTTTGKNLFDKSKCIFNKSVYPDTGNEHTNTSYVISNFIPVIPNTTYYSSTGVVYFYRKDKTFIQKNRDNQNPVTFTTTDDCYFIRVRNWGILDSIELQSSFIETVQIEEGSTATSYEPYKTNILTVNEEVELRGIGEVQDELNLLTGELTQRIGEIVLNGSENWVKDTTKEKTQVFFYDSEFSIKGYNSGICDKFIFYPVAMATDVEKIVMDAPGKIYIAIEKTKCDSVSNFKTWLSNNNVFIQYILATESIKTVVLSVIDQDGNVLPKIKTFNDTTHVNVSSDGILPKVEMEVATYNEEDIANANVMTASMDEIYSVQNELDNTNSIQSEEIDSTMIASTEIYENIL